jgi:hypothetical protein
MGALTVKYSFSNGSFWECPFCPKTAIMGAEPTVRERQQLLIRQFDSDRPQAHLCQSLTERQMERIHPPSTATIKPTLVHSSRVPNRAEGSN